MLVNYEYTDTFGGEANYSWVRRGTVEATESNFMRKVKAKLGLSGVRGVRTDFGDMVEFRPYGSATVLFIMFDHI